MSPEFGSPIGLLIRPADKYGSGEYGAPRSRDGAPHPHYGLDICTIPGQSIIAPVPVKIVREARPYADGTDHDVLSGVVLETMDQIQIKVLYVLPHLTLIGQFVPRGRAVAVAQSLQRRYPGITNHAHFEVWIRGERVDPTRYFLETA